MNIEPEMITMRKFKKMKLSRDAHKHNAEWFSEARSKAVKECNKYRKYIDELKRVTGENDDEFAYVNGVALYSFNVYLAAELIGTIIRTRGDFHAYDNTANRRLPAWMLHVLARKMDDLDSKIED